MIKYNPERFICVYFWHRAAAKPSHDAISLLCTTLTINIISPTIVTSNISKLTTEIFIEIATTQANTIDSDIGTRSYR